MYRCFALISALIAFTACKQKMLYVEYIDRAKFCNYFTVKTSRTLSNNKPAISFQTSINNVANDTVAAFINAYNHRFSYLITKEEKKLFSRYEHLDTNILPLFCKAVSSDSFYQNFCSLTSGSRVHPEVRSHFSRLEMMMVAARFFYCADVSKKDTSITTYICVGMNGTDDLPRNRNYTVLEAFCFEALIENYKRDAAFNISFRSVLQRAIVEEKAHYTTWANFLGAVRNRCYETMAKDPEVERVLMNHYRNNRHTLNFDLE